MLIIYQWNTNKSSQYELLWKTQLALKSFSRRIEQKHDIYRVKNIVYETLKLSFWL